MLRIENENILSPLIYGDISPEREGVKNALSAQVYKFWNNGRYEEVIMKTILNRVIAFFAVLIPFFTVDYISGGFFSSGILYYVSVMLVIVAVIAVAHFLDNRNK